MKRYVNELGRVEEILKRGYIELYESDGWMDVILMFKHYYSEGLKPREAKASILPLLRGYDDIEDLKKLNNLMYNIRAKKDYTLLNVESVDIPIAAIEWFDSQDLSLEYRRLLFTFYAWSMLQKQYRGTNSYCKTTCEPTTQKRVKKASGVVTKDAIWRMYCELCWKGYIAIPMFTMGWDSVDAKGNYTNQSCADKYLSKNNLEIFKQGDWSEEFRDFLNKIDDMRPQYNTFIEQVPTEGECIKVPSNELLNSPGEFYYAHTTKLRKGEHRVFCNKCGKPLVTKSKNWKQGCVCEECKREYNRLKKQESRKKNKEEK